ncbi:arrestin domain-containing protein 3-like isoform X1 [Gadus macrocephalus]|uniref:arrestin domain-containing protein 3-like isoform X1 n=1 Tax=Gadus macrocephalus TaxID=80720 RepID=UPI0028CB2672|nr:arrestin domain-containing protein 3-like isoform X1 [Gadus macrocephalus]
MTIKHLRVECDQKNGTTGAFSPGDILFGRVMVMADKETKVQCLIVKAKGKVEVKWPEQQGNGPPVVISDKKRYFYFEKILLQDKKADGSVIIGQGENSYSFSFDIPNRDMPSSYEGKWGSITYSLHTKLTQTAWQVYKAKTRFPVLTKNEFPFGSKSEMIIIGLKESQCATRISFCGSGKVTVNVSTENMGLTQSESMEVKAEVLNDSAFAVTPRFYVCEKQTFVTRSQRTVVHVSHVEFGTGGCAVPAASATTIARVLTAPPQLHPTFFNCSMMRLEYRLKVMLEFAQARNAEIKLPLIILRGYTRPLEQKTKKSQRFKSLPGRSPLPSCTN